MSEIEQLKQDEGFRAKLYYCSEGKPTIGYGLNLESGITEEEAEVILALRVDKIRNSLNETFPWFDIAPLEIQDVMTNMVYQMGLAGLLKFKRTLKYLEFRQYDSAAREMLSSRWAKQTPERASRLYDRVLGEHVNGD